ncbi:MAG: sulfatase-like hydrolase/transferase [Planctomycetes bacterium]|nr:sulfatase-like hydrolase/transferase [Planctomycetota bacterium]MCH9724142.1 sulfatase-like hydrolase/transferase [Planctomycetota bacterium]MCH9778039.1 sulfatase-like hydrolase/transferase [Planctomycetota bacterium]MCH9790732.1 sulfatase-like hydrolase/transferase [Planctomycetota bacterium]
MRFLFQLLVITCLTHTSNSLFSAEQRNVLILFSDNQNWNDCGCYGNQIVKTPNIDQLAREGTRYEQAFATTASCGPCRGVFYTGLHVHANGQYGHPHGDHNFRLKPKVKTIFSLLAQNHYRTGMIGKYHLFPEDTTIDFKPKINGYRVQGMADLADDFLKQKSDQPFFLVMGFHDPHPTSRTQPEWGVKVKEQGMALETYDPDSITVPSYLPDRPEVRQGLAGYYQQISYMDTAVGRILQSLKAAGKADNTLVIFTSDHGSSEPGAMANHYEPGVRIPFIVRNPKLKQESAGVVSDSLVSLLDVTPTILDWTNTKGPKYPLHGRSVLPTVGKTNTPGWDETFLSHVFHEVTMYYPMRTIRTRDFKLIWNLEWRSKYPLPIDTLSRATWNETLRLQEPLLGQRTVKKFLFRDEVELYDLKNDPDEVINLACQPEFQAVRKTLSEKLLKHLEQTDDLWLKQYTLPVSCNTTAADQQSEYKSLFNGRDLTGWTLKRANRKGYHVEEGKLICPAEGGGFLFTEHEYSDFSLKFDFKLTKGANNGIAVRCPLVDQRPAYAGIEIQVLDNKGYPKKLKPTQYHGSVYDVIPAKRGALKPAGEWNHEEIIYRGSQITVIVNDIPVLRTDLAKITDAEILTKHPGLKNRRGHIGLLGHGSHVEYKNILIKEF